MKNLKYYIETKNIDQIEYLLLHSRKEFFMTPNMKELYDSMKSLQYLKSESFLTLAWLALLSGDNLGLYQFAKQILQEELSSQSIGFYYDLEALSGVFGSVEERLQMSQKALEVFHNQNSFYLANAYLTHGQILVGFHKLRDAALYFEKAFEIFLKEKMYFPASVSMTNACLNLYRLGEVKTTIEKINRVFLIASQFGAEDSVVWDVLRLPFGMCYYENGKYEIARDELIKAQKAINQMNLIHMHGYIEIYLVRLFSITDRKEDLRQLLEETEKLFSHMHYPMMDMITYYARLHLGDEDDKMIEHLNSLYEQDNMPQPLLIEIMAYLYSCDKSRKLTENDIVKLIELQRFEGDRANLMISLLFLMERYDREQKKDAIKPLLDEIYELYYDFGLIAAISLYPYRMPHLLKKIIPTYETKRNANQILTNKELEILKLMSEGFDNEQIANQLYVSIGTIKWHINHIFSKLYVKNRVSAIIEAKKQKLL